MAPTLFAAQRVTAVQFEPGFSDQAHATRQVKRATGLTPARLRDELRNDRDGRAAIEIAAAFVRGYA